MTQPEQNVPRGTSTPVCFHRDEWLAGHCFCGPCDALYARLRRFEKRRQAKVADWLMERHGEAITAASEAVCCGDVQRWYFYRGRLSTLMETLEFLKGLDDEQAKEEKDGK